MILSFSIIQYLFYTFFTCYNFYITSVSAAEEKGAGLNLTQEKLNISPNNSETTVFKPITPSKTTFSTTTPPIEESTASIVEQIPSNVDEITSAVMLPLVPVTHIISNKINSTKISQNSNSSLPIILGLIFGSLAIIVLITSVFIYLLIKEGSIKIFNPPRTRIKDIERTRMVDSSSIIGGTSPSRR